MPREVIVTPSATDESKQKKTTGTTVWQQGRSGHVKRILAERDVKVQLGEKWNLKLPWLY